MGKVKFAQEKVRRGQGSPSELRGASPQQEEGSGQEDTGEKHGENKGQGHQDSRVGSTGSSSSGRLPRAPHSASFSSHSRCMMLGCSYAIFKNGKTSLR